MEKQESNTNKIQAQSQIIAKKQQSTSIKQREIVSPHHQQKIIQSQSQNQSNKNSQRSRSRQKKQKQKRYQSKQQSDEGHSQQQLKRKLKPERQKAGEMNYHQFIQKQEQFHANQEVLRSFLRIQGGRSEPIDKFVQVLYTYKGKYQYDSKLIEIMNEPKKYLNKLTQIQLRNMIIPAKRHLQSQQKYNSEYIKYWNNLIELIQYKIIKKQQKTTISQSITDQEQNSLQSFQIKQKIKAMLNKPTDQLVKLNRKIQIMLKNSSFGMDMSYWEKIKLKVKGKLLEAELKKYYQIYKQEHLKNRQNQQQIIQNSEDQGEPISPILQSFMGINPKFLVTEQQQKEDRLKLSESIFRQQFQKCKQKLQVNLSLPKNHNLLSKDFVEQSSKTYDLITQQIMEFEKYKRMEQDQEQFDEWIPVETEGRFRDRKPEYINRVRVSYDQKKYGMSGIIKQRVDEKQPPPKQIQGYKFNIFYPDLFDKQKTPQYYLQALEDPNYCLIKFKAGPPYKDVAFKILRKQWDFTQKSGFEAIFTKGILQLYFNFKKPKFRI